MSAVDVAARTRPGDLTRAEAADRTRLLRIDGYDLAVDLTDATRFTVVSTIRFRCTIPGRSTFVDLLDAQVEQVLLNGRALDVAAEYDGRRLRLPDLAAENELRVVSHSDYATTGVGLHRMIDPADGRSYLFTQFEVAHARRVFACFDQPDLGAPFTLTVTAPAHWAVLSTSATPAPTVLAGGDATWRFAPTPVLATYQFALVAGEYAVVAADGPVPLRLACRQSMVSCLDADEVFAATRNGLTHFADLFAHPFPFAKLDQVFVPDYGMVGMENAACVTLSEDFLFRSRVTASMRDQRTDVILHEVAHMWFGNLVRIAWWSDLWLKEAVVTYLSTRCRAIEAPDAWQVFAVASGWARAQDEEATTHAVAEEVPSVTAIEINYDPITYGKGAAVFRQLAATIGDETLVRGLRQFVHRYAGHAVTLADLVATLGEAAGRDLGEWCQRWLCSAGVDVLRAELTSDGDRISTFEVVRDAATDDAPRPHRLAVGCYVRRPEGIVRTARHDVLLTGARVAVPGIVGERAPDLVLVNDGELSYARGRLDPVSVATIRHGIAEIRDPLARTQCWGAAWDMVRDAELAARDFLTMVESGIDAEEQVSAVQTLLVRASAALDDYTDPAYRPTGRARLAALALEGVRAAPAGGDRQLCWAWTLALQATTSDQLALAERLLTGAETIPGLTLDTELRWAILRRLVACGTVDVDRVEAELRRDPTAAGRCRAAGVRAAAPTLAAKQEAWQLAVGSPDIEPELLSWVLFSFSQPDQTDLLAHFVEPYFARLDELWRARVPELAQMLVVALYPSTQVHADVAARTDRYLAEADPPAELRRLLSTRRADLRRALRARAFDRAAGRRASP
ncbi:aminopeptidase N [Micromonospora sp. NPDC048170]|uniref:aminopeptidase N n=1 Tax=Micromonospora sp. NPDC048170 TaxID=3154819 RepID=UPI0033D74382